MSSTKLPRTELSSISSTLLDRARQMQPEAWGRLVQVFGPVVYRWCRQSGLPAHDAADVVQEVFVSVSRGIAGFQRSEPQDSFRSWLATITRNRVRDYFRRQTRQPPAQGGSEGMARLQDVPDVEQSVSTDGLEGEVTRQVVGLVRAEFEDRTWRAFWLTTVDQRQAAVVASELGMSVAAVYQAKSRVLRRLRQQLKELPQ